MYPIRFQAEEKGEYVLPFEIPPAMTKSIAAKLRELGYLRECRLCLMVLRGIKLPEPTIIDPGLPPDLAILTKSIIKADKDDNKQHCKKSRTRYS